MAEEVGANLDSVHIGGGHMDRQRLERLARLIADRDQLIDEINEKRALRDECPTPAVDKWLLARIDALWEEYDHVSRNIRNVELGQPEEAWLRTDAYKDLQPEDGAPLH